MDDQHPTLEQLMSDLLTQGGGHASDSIAGPASISDMLRREIEGQQAALVKEARLFANVLWHDAAGRKILDELIDMTIRRPQWPAWEVTDPQMLTMYGVGRQFQNELVRAIIVAINHALEARNSNSSAKGEDDDE